MQVREGALIPGSGAGHHDHGSGRRRRRSMSVLKWTESPAASVRSRDRAPASMLRSNAASVSGDSECDVVVGDDRLGLQNRARVFEIGPVALPEPLRECGDVLRPRRRVPRVPADVDEQRRASWGLRPVARRATWTPWDSRVGERDVTRGATEQRPCRGGSLGRREQRGAQCVGELFAHVGVHRE